MFFEKELLSFSILDVCELHQQNFSGLNSGRNFSALSFRFSADTILKTKTQEIHATDNSVCYVPERLDYSRVSKNDELIAVHFSSIDYRTDAIESFTPKNPKKLADLFRRILECWEKKESGYLYRSSALLYEIFAECYEQNYTKQPCNSKISNSVDYLLKNYKNADLTISDVAQKSFMSDVYFRKLFKKEYGVSPQKYVIDLRIQYAIGLIATGYYSLQEIAYASGYNDYKYFSSEFKKTTGVCPSKYVYDYQK